MKKDLIYWLRWIAALPGAIFCGILASSVLHWILYLTLRNKVIFIDPYPELPENLLSPFVVSLLFVWAGSCIAPGYRHRTSRILLAGWIVLIMSFFFLALFGVKLCGIQLYLKDGGITAIMSIIGAVTGYYASLKTLRDNN